MKVIHFNEGYRFGNPNLRWGNPSYVLEPGDPGYVPYPPVSTVVQTQKRKKSTMAKADYIEQNDDAFSAQLQTFATNIPPYATTVGLTTTEVADQAADAAYYRYVLACLATMKNGAQQWTAWRDLVRGGGTPPPAGMPMAPVFPASVLVVLLGIEVRFRALVAKIKTHANYNVPMGEALGIEGEEITGPDMMTIQPLITGQVAADHVRIGWGWQGHREFLDACELQVDRNDGHGYVLLCHDTTPNYNDTQPFPTTPTKWTYRAIYRVGDARVGQWSNPVSVMVG